MDRLDWHYRYNAFLADGYRLADGALPSDHFRRNVYISFTEDPLVIALRDMIGGSGHLLWGSDFPHAESTFPRSPSIVAGQIGALDPAEQLRIGQRNCADLYGFDPAKLPVPPALAAPAATAAPGAKA
ncbi:MAG TPA: hypothetical protein VHB02_17430 [Acidimicrobiales bacterium]|nr:hypothetical protein [Acidimicrobiales bacterium]